MKNVHDIIVRPIITEASMAMGADKKYVFAVDKTATKPEIADAIEKVFKVEVKTVNTINYKKKATRQRGFEGFKPAWKKAIVTLKPDSKTIEFFDGMM